MHKFVFLYIFCNFPKKPMLIKMFYVVILI
jgi:hypothetical protein